MTEVDLFDYELPEQLVAAVPAERRSESRLMRLDRRTGALEHRRFSELPELLEPDDVLVLNNARVLPARLYARRETGGRVEVLLVRREEALRADTERWWALLRSSGTLREDERLSVEDSDSTVRLLRAGRGGEWLVEVERLKEALEGGRMPLPPYILRARRERGLPEEMPEVDQERYQTVFADEPGAVAAPTAGLHFTPELLREIHDKGVEVRMLSLLVGPGTFRPVRTKRLEDHELEAESFHLPAATALAVERALKEDRRVVATGTTCCRVLEYVARHGAWEEQSGWTDLYIYPPFEFKVVGGLITNFHLPRSTLLMLVSAFAGRERVLAAYREAVRREYRFYSYGDAMFIT
ncbi:MAG: tRNA preQ1(34) S-adenosylmethionine ribosyltransferase-isomerase QueA [Candidatus Brocadiia bacterium]